MDDDLLLQVKRPGRYIGEEWNVSRKDFEKAEVKFALCFPDLYEVGMSNLGVRIIYGMLNNSAGVVCERFFAPDTDMEKILRTHDLEIFSLESKRRLCEFDIAGFSLGHELGYSNVLNILDLGKIPLAARERGREYPLVIGGGPCVLNPEPLHEFFDLFVIGESEEALAELLETYRSLQHKYKSAAMSKEDLLLALARIEGVYVPSFYEVTYAPSGDIASFTPKLRDVPARIKKRFVKDFENSFFPEAWLVPNVQVVHDRITLEVMRGCPNTCSFCQARQQYFPYRVRQPQRILQLAAQAYRLSGYEELSLGGLSVSDYPHLAAVLTCLIGLFKDRGVSTSLPSIKPKAQLGELSSLIATIKKTGHTFAPEAASERLRTMLHKNFDERDFFDTLAQAYKSGYQHIKLYFMIGLPSETEADLDAIIEFAQRASELRRGKGLGPAQVNISITTLIPKPHTPLQWLKMEGLQEMQRKQECLKKKAARHKRLRLHFHNPYMSFLEGIFSRGDRRLSRVLLTAFEQGARFDAWDDYFVFERWEKAFAACAITPEFYLREKPREEVLPWDVIDVGIHRETLKDEFEKIVDM